MSVNRENVIWQSKDGTWNRGFYAFDYINEDSEDFDHEWDVEYHNHFHWVSTGHRTEQSAYDSWRGANPGGSVTLAYDTASAADSDRYDRLAAECKAQQARTVSTRAARW